MARRRQHVNVLARRPSEVISFVTCGSGSAVRIDIASEGQRKDDGHTQRTV
jgi:hypothetical protein